jgi:nifR3 family TIM-barrel protein
MNFWQKLKLKTTYPAGEKFGEKAGKLRPLFVLAPMADVTDEPFRQTIAKYGRPDAMWTEFVSADGLIRATPEGKAKLMKDLLFSESERPIVAQLFSSNPEYMEQAAKLVADLGFDGIDINMGCPDRGIEKQGAGAGMIKNPKLAQEVVRAAMRGAPNLPVSVKTRIGYNKNELETWLPAILETNPTVVTIHARTRKEMSKVPARWEHVKRAVEIRDEFFANQSEKTLIFGNGDITSIVDGLKRAEESGADGVMLGRAIFGNPWLFAELANLRDFVPDVKQKLNVLVEHTKLFDEILGGENRVKNFAVMKKHFKAYVNGFDGAKELRDELMQTENAAEVEGLVNKWVGRL